MPETIKITLGDKSYDIRRLTLRQLRELQIGSVKAVRQPEDLAERVMFSYASDLAIIVTALSRDYPDITAEGLLDLETTKAEVGAAALEILKFSGLVPSGEEKAPVPETESTGATSTAD